MINAKTRMGRYVVGRGSFSGQRTLTGESPKQSDFHDRQVTMPNPKGDIRFEPPVDATGCIERRLQRLEAYELVSRLQLNALFHGVERLDRALDLLEADVDAWAQRSTPEAQSDRARSARDMLKAVIDDLRQSSQCHAAQRRTGGGRPR